MARRILWLVPAILVIICFVNTQQTQLSTNNLIPVPNDAALPRDNLHKSTGSPFSDWMPADREDSKTKPSRDARNRMSECLKGENPGPDDGPIGQAESVDGQMLSHSPTVSHHAMAFLEHLTRAPSFIGHLIRQSTRTEILSQQIRRTDVGREGEEARRQQPDDGQIHSLLLPADDLGKELRADISLQSSPLKISQSVQFHDNLHHRRHMKMRLSKKPIPRKSVHGKSGHPKAVISPAAKPKIDKALAQEYPVSLNKTLTHRAQDCMRNVCRHHGGSKRCQRPDIQSHPYSSMLCDMCMKNDQVRIRDHCIEETRGGNQSYVIVGVSVFLVLTITGFLLWILHFRRRNHKRAILPVHEGKDTMKDLDPSPWPRLHWFVRFLGRLPRCMRPLVGRTCLACLPRATLDQLAIDLQIAVDLMSSSCIDSGMKLSKDESARSSLSIIPTLLVFPDQQGVSAAAKATEALVHAQKPK